jgi:hypothetical protein
MVEFQGTGRHGKNGRPRENDDIGRIKFFLCSIGFSYVASKIPL